MGIETVAAVMIWLCVMAAPSELEAGKFEAIAQHEERGETVSDPVSRILELDREIASLEAALAARPGNIESYELSSTLDYREKQRQELLDGLNPEQQRLLAEIRTQSR